MAEGSDNTMMSTGNSQLMRTEVDASIVQEPDVVNESREYVVFL